MRKVKVYNLFMGLFLATLIVVGTFSIVIPTFATDGNEAVCTVESCDGIYENGFCKNCDAYQEPTKDDSGVYQISNAGNLYWFAAHINQSSKNINANAELTANITVNVSVLTNYNLNSGTFRQWTPIGNDSNYAYKGTFDGNGKTISGLYYSGSENYIGLFGNLDVGAKLQNVDVTDSYLQTESDIPGCTYIGGLVGKTTSYASEIVIQNCSFSGVVSCSTGIGTTPGTYPYPCVGGLIGYAFGATVTNCYSTAKVTAIAYGAYTYAGGLIGDGCSTTVQNCYNAGTVVAQSSGGMIYVGGLVGYDSNDLALDFCYNIGEVIGSGSDYNTYVGSVIGYRLNNKDTVTNCYYLKADGITGISGTSDTTGKIEAMSVDAFASGEVSYLLNGERSEGTAEKPLVWYQNLGTGGDDYPTLDVTHGIVYKDGSTYINSATEPPVSVTITLSSLAFTYTNGAWNPNTHSYSDGTWSAGEGNGTVAVENTGTVAVQARFIYTPTIDGIRGNFDKSSFDLAAGEKDATTLTLSGKPRTNLSNESIGSITVTIAKKVD